MQVVQSVSTLICRKIKFSSKCGKMSPLWHTIYQISIRFPIYMSQLYNKYDPFYATEHIFRQILSLFLLAGGHSTKFPRGLVRYSLRVNHVRMEKVTNNSTIRIQGFKNTRFSLFFVMGLCKGLRAYALRRCEKLMGEVTSYSYARI